MGGSLAAAAARHSSSKLTECPFLPFASPNTALPPPSAVVIFSNDAGDHRSETLPLSAPRVTLIPLPRWDTKACDPGMRRRPPGVHAAPSAIRAPFPPPAGRGAPSSISAASTVSRSCMTAPSPSAPKDIWESKVRESIAPRSFRFSSLGLEQDRRPTLDPAARPSRRLSKELSRPSLGGGTTPGREEPCWPPLPAVVGPAVVAASSPYRPLRAWPLDRLYPWWWC